MSASSLKLMIYIESLLGKATDFINTLCGIFFFSSVKMYFIMFLGLGVVITKWFVIHAPYQ